MNLSRNKILISIGMIYVWSVQDLIDQFIGGFFALIEEIMATIATLYNSIQLGKYIGQIVGG